MSTNAMYPVMSMSKWRRRWNTFWKNLILCTLLAVIALTVLFPILFTLSGSFMGGEEVVRNFGDITISDAFTPMHLLPDHIQLDGYADLFIRQPSYLMRFWISLGICAAITVGQLVISILGGYAFSKFKFPGRDAIFYCIIVLMLLPYQVTLTPTYRVVRALGLLNTSYSLILPGIFSAFGVFLMRQIMEAVPDSLLESAYLDGAGSFVTLWRILVPNCKSGIVTLTVLSFVDAWNMVEQPIVFIQDTFKQPLSVFLLSVNAQSMALGFACGVLSMIPAVLLLVFFEDQLMEGISYSVLK